MSKVLASEIPQMKPDCPHYKLKAKSLDILSRHLRTKALDASENHLHKSVKKGRRNIQ